MFKVTKLVNKLINTIISVSIKLIVYALVLLVLVRGSFLAYHFGYDIFENRSKLSGNELISLDIEEGSSIYDIAKLLKEKGIINNEYIFIIQSKIFSYKIKPGHYDIEEGENIKKILGILNAGIPQEEN